MMVFTANTYLRNGNKTGACNCHQVPQFTVHTYMSHLEEAS